MNSIINEALNTLINDIVPAFAAQGMNLEHVAVPVYQEGKPTDETEHQFIYQSEDHSVYVELYPTINGNGKASVHGHAEIPVKTVYSGRTSTTDYSLTNPSEDWLEQWLDVLPLIKKGDVELF